MVLITGMGIVCSAGNDILAFQQSLKNGRSGITSKPEVPKPLGFANSKIGGFIQDFNLDKAIDPDLLPKVKKIVQRMPLNIQVAVAATLQAWKQAGLKSTDRVGLVVAGNNISQGFLYESFTTFQKEPTYLTPTYALNFLDTNHVGTISEILGLKDLGMCVGGASASGNVAIIEAYRLVKFGIALEAFFKAINIDQKREVGISSF